MRLRLHVQDLHHVVVIAVRVILRQYKVEYERSQARHRDCSEISTNALYDRKGRGTHKEC